MNDRYFQSDANRRPSVGRQFRQVFGDRYSRPHRRGRGRHRGRGGRYRFAQGAEFDYKREEDRKPFDDRRDGRHDDSVPNEEPRFGDAGGRRGLQGSSRPLPRREPTGFHDEFPSRRRDHGTYSNRFAGFKRDREQEPEPDVNLTSLRPRKKVAGGRIEKPEKVEEYKTESLYCDACERGFPDLNAKAVHDRSADHVRNINYNRKADFRRREANDRDRTIGTGSDVIAEKKPGNKIVADFTPPQVQKFFQENGNRFLKPFTAWANRSLMEAKRLEDQGDPIIVQAVQKEIIADFMFYTDECTMRSESWGRKPLASGMNYRGEEVARYRELIVPSPPLPPPPPPPETQARTATVVKESEKAQKLGEPRWDRGGMENVSPKEKALAGNSSSAGGRPQDASTGMSTGVEVAVGGNRGGNSVPDVAPATGANRSDDMRPLPIRWNVRRGSAAMLRHQACQVKRHQNVQKMRAFAPRLTNTANRVEHVETESVTALMKNYNVQRKQFEAENYDYPQWNDSLSSIIAGLRGRNTRLATVQSCYQMQAIGAINAEDWGNCFNACNELVKMYKEETDTRWVEHGAEFVGYWVLSLLFKVARKAEQSQRMPMASKRAGSSPLLMINAHMRDLPLRALDSALIHECLVAFSSVVSNNFCRFFSVYNCGLMHHRTGNRTKYLMDELADVVRERSIVLMSMMSPLREEAVFHPPVRLVDAMRWLGWKDHKQDDSTDSELVNARDFITRLPQGICLKGAVENGRNVSIATSSRLAEIGTSDVVDVEALLKMNAKVWRLQTA